jgi:hypothetical protein
MSNGTLPTSLLPWSSNDLSVVRLEINGVSVPDRPWFLRSMPVTLPEPSHVMSTKVSLHTSPLPNHDSGGLDNSLEMVHTSLKLATMKERDAMMTMMRRNALIAMANLGEFTENFLTFSLFSLSLNNGGGSSHSLSDGDRSSLSQPLSLCDGGRSMVISGVTVWCFSWWEDWALGSLYSIVIGSYTNTHMCT